MIAWRGISSTGLVSSADWAYMKAPSYAELWDKVSQTDSHTYEKADGFFLKIEMGGKAILGLSRLDYPTAKASGAVNGGAFMRRSF